ncbi:PadR family transcriptional regulator [Clostridiaceae bacterium M8S5]|nr:PadR family transcriptional regulator [Clostridiaceae bacterium M8S5]
MYDDIQLKRGILDGCVLKIISRQETYGYEIINILERYGFGNLSEGTMYPILKRLQNKGYITSEFKKSSLGPKRKYYSITDDGKKQLNDFKVLWRSVSSNVNSLLEGSE